MFEGNEFSPLEIMDAKISSALNSLIWAIANVKSTELPKTKQKTLRRALIAAQDAVNVAIKVIDQNSDH